MNTMTFTIESVHGVKQTFVLGPTAKVTDRDTSSTEASTQSEHDLEVKRTSSRNTAR